MVYGKRWVLEQKGSPSPTNPTCRLATLGIHKVLKCSMLVFDNITVSPQSWILEDFEDLNESTKATETEYGPWYSPISGLHDGHSRVHLFQGAVRWFIRISFVRRWFGFTRFRRICHLLGGEFQWQLCRDALRVEQGRILWDEHKIRAEHLCWSRVTRHWDSSCGGDVLTTGWTENHGGSEPWTAMATSWFSPLQRMLKSLSQTCCRECDSWPVLLLSNVYDSIL